MQDKKRGCDGFDTPSLKGLEAKPLPLWALAPLWIIFKGVKNHIGTSKAGTIIYPSAEADGKREPTARHPYYTPVNHHFWFKSAKI